MKKFFISLALILALVCVSMPSHAEHGGIGSLISTSLLGTSIGILIGATTLIFTNDPGDHNDRVTYGAARGFACGFALGLSGMISPTYSSSTTPGGAKDRVYGLRVYIPLNQTP
jgi:hypothetical protein